MPLYEYQCQKCSHRFEKIESVSASLTKKCPKCGARAGRLPAAPAIQFKGTGWYVTDYAGKNSSGSPADKSESKPKEPAAKSESKSKESKGESKPSKKE